MPLRPIAPAVLALLAACSSPAEVAEKTGVAAHATASASASAAGSKGAAVAVEEENDLYSYGFSHPAQVGAYPELAQQLQAAAEKQKVQLIAEAKEGQADAKANGYPFNPHSYSEEWQVVADVPGYLSLTDNIATFSGGAHGMYDTGSLVWDKSAKSSMKGVEMFRSADALEAALGPRLCTALNAERAKRRGAEWKPKKDGGSSYGFDECQHVKDATVIVGSSNKRTFDRIGIWFGPYVAGPYAEGAYELDFPMTAAMVEAVKPAYRAAFSAKR